MKRIEILEPYKSVHGQWAENKHKEMQTAGEIFMHYTKGAKDLEIKGLTWDTYGKQDEELLIFVARYKGKSWYAAHKSQIVHPKMIERMFKIDVRDSNTENWVQNEMMDYIIEEIGIKHCLEAKKCKNS